MHDREHAWSPLCSFQVTEQSLQIFFNQISKIWTCFCSLVGFFVCFSLPRWKKTVYQALSRTDQSGVSFRRDPPQILVLIPILNPKRFAAQACRINVQSNEGVYVLFEKKKKKLISCLNLSIIEDVVILMKTLNWREKEEKLNFSIYCYCLASLTSHMILLNENQTNQSASEKWLIHFYILLSFYQSRPCQT